MKRQDEEYIKDAISKYLKKTLSKDFTIAEGEDPPDYYVYIGSDKILLEVTTSEEKRRTTDTSLSMFCNQINNQFESRISGGMSLLLQIAGPIPNKNYSDFKKSVIRIIEEIIRKEIFDEWMCFDIANETIKIKKIKHSEHWRKKVIGLITNKGGAYEFGLYTQAILEEILKIKESKTKIINGQEWKGEKWLGILNNFIIDEPYNFQKAIRNIDVKHTFSRIFLVCGNSEVVEIFSKTPIYRKEPHHSKTGKRGT